MTSRGWIGTKSQLLHYLGTVGADKGKDGRFFVRGDIISFMGMDVGPETEMIVGPNAEFFIDGAARGLVVGLGSTSYGSCPIVII